MDSIIEVQRQTHSEIERLEAALSTLLATQHKTHKDHLSAEHKASDILDRIVARSVTLQEQYQDIDETRKAEVELLTAPSHVEKELDEFYARLKCVKDFHHRYPNRPVDGFDLELRGIVGDPEDEDMDVEVEDSMGSLFSGEERYGLCLDLYTSHTQYNNLKHIKKRLQYLQYFDVLATVQNGLHAELPQETQHGKDYEAGWLSYLSGLYSYLLSFTKRTQPLVDVDTTQQQVEEEFNKLWEEGKIDGWTSGPQTNGDSAVEGIWCPTCQRSYAKQTVYDAHLSSRKHIKATAKASEAPAPSVPANGNHQTSTWSSTSAKLRVPARLTYLITALLVQLQSTLAETKANVERRFSLTSRERETELVEDIPSAPPVPAADGTAGEAAEEPEEEEKIYNPLKLPLGWDGKPIPYWLYKLHGLGVEYRCEICSDHVYMGRKNFERHFQEPRHAFGMRALGLPNTKHFHEITKIEDALALAEKLKREGRKEISQAETTEEMEDEEGNVYNRKTFDDLKKQGLI